jgi:6-pyruvoyltetrahydropterin/6-carboxytetrahydropterin synthase
MPDLTHVLAPEKSWKVYRLKTLSSEYHLGVFAGESGHRPCAILRGLSRGLGQLIDLQDSAPLIGGKSLFGIPPEKWIGKSLEMGTATTSPIQSVEEEKDLRVIASLTRAVARAVVESETRPVPRDLMTPQAQPVPTRHTRRLFVGKDVHKFSSAHMSIFPDGTKEKLHGHNFRVSVALEHADTSVEDMLDLAMVKQALVEQCAAWDQRLLLPARSPLLTLLPRQEDDFEFKLCGRRYVVPADEVLLLPVVNVVVETLAEAFAHALLDRLNRLRGPEQPGALLGIEVTLTESENQGASYALKL